MFSKCVTSSARLPVPLDGFDFFPAVRALRVIVCWLLVVEAILLARCYEEEEIGSLEVLLWQNKLRFNIQLSPK